MRECPPPPPCVTCPGSIVTFRISGVTCQVSHVRCHMHFFYKVVELVGGGSVINGAYPVFFDRAMQLLFLQKAKQYQYLILYYKPLTDIVSLFYPSTSLDAREVLTCSGSQLSRPYSLYMEERLAEKLCKVSHIIPSHVFSTILYLQSVCTAVHCSAMQCITMQYITMHCT